MVDRPVQSHPAQHARYTVNRVGGEGVGVGNDSRADPRAQENPKNQRPTETTIRATTGSVDTRGDMTRGSADLRIRSRSRTLLATNGRGNRECVKGNEGVGPARIGDRTRYEGSSHRGRTDGRTTEHFTIARPQTARIAYYLLSNRP